MRKTGPDVGDEVLSLIAMVFLRSEENGNWGKNKYSYWFNNIG